VERRRHCWLGVVGGERRMSEKCYECGESGHFARHCPNSTRGDEGENGGYRGGARGKSCYNCGVVGHQAKECPNQGEKTCYNCGNTGHVSKDCQDPPSANAPRPPARRRASKPKCYNCGEFGHLSKDCPNKDSGPKCYNCGNYGHISGHCNSAPADGELNE